MTTSILTATCPHCLEEDIHTKLETDNEIWVSHDETQPVPEFDYCPKCKYDNLEERIQEEAERKAEDAYDVKRDLTCQSN